MRAGAGICITEDSSHGYESEVKIGTRRYRINNVLPCLANDTICIVRQKICAIDQCCTVHNDIMSELSQGRSYYAQEVKKSSKLSRHWASGLQSNGVDPKSVAPVLASRDLSFRLTNQGS